MGFLFIIVVMIVLTAVFEISTYTSVFGWVNPLPPILENETYIEDSLIKGMLVPKGKIIEGYISCAASSILFKWHWYITPENKGVILRWSKQSRELDKLYKNL